MRRKRHRVADQPAAIDQQQELRTTYLPTYRRQAIRNFVGAEMPQAQYGIFLLEDDDPFGWTTLANQRLGNIGAAFHFLKLICDRDLSPREIDGSQHAGKFLHVCSLDLQSD